MTVDLIYMANQIAAFFGAYPESDAVIGIRDHLTLFWTPAMRAELVAIASGEQPGRERVHALVLQAASLLQPSGGG